ncbi:MAG TPA: RnfABCDGE type electron transport complex subunit D, partial [Cellvibrio sp.]
MSLRKILDNMEPHFHKGGKYEKWYALYEAADTIFYKPADVTKSTAHVRDGVDLKRIMITVWLCAFPAMFFGMYNVGLQANTILAATGATGIDNWHGALTAMFAGHNPDSIWDNLVLGAAYFLPI